MKGERRIAAEASGSEAMRKRADALR